MPRNTDDVEFERALRAALRWTRRAVAVLPQDQQFGDYVDLTTVEQQLLRLLEGTSGVRAVMPGQLSIVDDPALRVAESETRRK